jgi:hypothetical protein
MSAVASDCGSCALPYAVSATQLSHNRTVSLQLETGLSLKFVLFDSKKLLGITGV